MKESITYILSYIAAIVVFLGIVKIIHLRQIGSLNRKLTFKILDWTIVLVSVAVILISILFDFNYLQYKAPVAHKDWQTITLNDFTGLKRPYNTLYGETKFAFISTSIHTEHYRHFIEIETFFHPSRSYVYNRDLYAEKLLLHELYHFHITEYCARMLRKEIKELADSGQTIDLNKLKKKTLLKERELQAQYDDETYHSYVLSKQLEWQRKIDSSLVSLEDYSNTIISLKK